MNRQFKRWLLGALNAVISGASAGIGADLGHIYTTPAHVGMSPKALAITAGVAGVVSLVKWLAQHPLEEILDAPEPPAVQAGQKWQG
jgi:hypothetical protein